jgi:hypothetical protein
MKHRKAVLRALLAPALASLQACSSIPLNLSETVEPGHVGAYAAQPIDHFDFEGERVTWRPLASNEALLWTSPDRAYLIEVGSTCPDLRLARRIAVTSTLNTVYSLGLDYVKVRGEQCPIERIRPVDYGQLRADRREKTEQRSVATGNSLNPNQIRDRDIERE